MSQGSYEAKFSCPNCGRRYPWKAEIAGHRCRCGCGEVIQVPQSLQSPVEDQGVDEPSGVTGAESAPAAVARESASSRVLAYRTNSQALQDRRFRDALTDPVRDIVVPVAVLVIGLLAIVAWVCFSLKMRGKLPALTSPQMSRFLLLFMLTVGVLDAIKVLVLIGLAFVLAPMWEVGFGLFRTALLKLAAIVVFIEGARLWLQVVLAASGAVGRNSGGGVFLMDWLLMSVILIAALSYLFGLDSDVRSFYKWMVAAMLAVDLVATLALGAYTGRPMRLRRFLPVSSAPTTNPPPKPPSVLVGSMRTRLTPNSNTLTPDDSRIMAAIAAGKASNLVWEGHEWKRMVPATVYKPSVDSMFDSLYRVGVVAVYVDGQGLSAGQPLKVYVELPPDPYKRAICASLVEKWQKSSAPSGQRQPNPALVGRFMEVEIRR